jgi:hypothetical protein
MPILGITASSILKVSDTGAMFPLQVVTVGPSGASSVTFSNIPNTYTHLQVRAIAQTAGAGQFVKMEINSDTGTNYNSHIIYGEGSSATASSYGDRANIPIWGNNTGTATSTFAVCVIDILDYANTNKYKTTRCLDGYDSNGSGVIAVTSGLWRNTNAITSIKFTGFSGNLNQYSQFALYGIKAA